MPTALSVAVGQTAMRVAALAGYKVVTTASPHNFDLLRSLGASTVFSYRSPDVIAQIKIAMGDSLRQAFDALGSGKNSEHNTLKSAQTVARWQHCARDASFPGVTSQTAA